MIWGFLPAFGAGLLVIVEKKINSQVYQDIPQNCRLDICKMKLIRSWMMQQDNYPKSQTSQIFYGIASGTPNPPFGWPNQSPHLDQIEMKLYSESCSHRLS